MVFAVSSEHFMTFRRTVGKGAAEAVVREERPKPEEAMLGKS